MTDRLSDSANNNAALERNGAPLTSGERASRVARAVSDLRRTSGRFTTKSQQGEAMIAMANAADLLESLEAELRRIHQIVGATINA